jgi:hypothetical protein
MRAAVGRRRTGGVPGSADIGRNDLCGRFVITVMCYFSRVSMCNGSVTIICGNLLWILHGSEEPFLPA